jgi:hypothetical protein
VGSSNADTWFNFATMTNGPVSAQYIYLNLWDSTGTNVPSIREIIWREEQEE